MFEEKLKLIHPELLLLTSYVNMKTPVLVQDYFGVCRYKPSDLVRVKKTNITSALNKHDYFVSRLRKIWGGDLYHIKSYYENDKSLILLDTPFGECKMIANNMLNGRKPDIRSALNPTDYVVKEFKSANGDKYSYEDVVYVNDVTPVNIKCQTHGTFSQLPTHHKRGFGCPACGYSSSNWSPKSYKNRVGNRFSEVYIIKCWNVEEEFYKIGITCLGLSSRYNRKMPYKYESVGSVVFEEGDQTWRTEDYLKSKLKKYRYTPNIKFEGYTECFKYIDEVYEEFKKVKKTYNV